MVNRLLHALGWVFVALALVGVALPLVPTTPFVILAAACFARSSPAAYRLLVASPVLGPVLHDWQHRQGMRLRAKIILMLAVVAVAAISLWFGGRAIQIAAVASLMVTATVLLVIRTIPRE